MYILILICTAYFQIQDGPSEKSFYLNNFVSLEVVVDTTNEENEPGNDQAILPAETKFYHLEKPFQWIKQKVKCTRSMLPIWEYG